MPITEEKATAIETKLKPLIQMFLGGDDGVKKDIKEAIGQLKEYYASQIENQHTEEDVNITANKIFVALRKTGILQLPVIDFGDIIKYFNATIDSKTKTISSHQNTAAGLQTKNKPEPLIYQAKSKPEKVIDTAVILTKEKVKNIPKMSDKDLESDAELITKNLYDALKQGNQLLLATNLILFINITKEQATRIFNKNIEDSTHPDQIKSYSLLSKRCNFFATEVVKKLPEEYETQTRQIIELNDDIWWKTRTTYETLADKQNEIGENIYTATTNKNENLIKLINDYFEQTKAILKFISTDLASSFLENLNEVLKQAEQIEEVVTSHKKYAGYKKEFAKLFSHAYLVMENHYSKIYGKETKPKQEHVEKIKNLILTTSGFTLENSRRVKEYRKILQHLEDTYGVTPKDYTQADTSQDGVAKNRVKPKR